LSALSGVLVAYAPLSGESPEDFERTVLLALANSLREKDKEAENLLKALVGTEKIKTVSKQISGGVEGKLAVLDIKGGGTISISDTETKKIEGVRFYIQELLNKASKKYDRVIIAVDEVDKKEPDKAKEIIVQCRDILHFNCSFILTGRLIGVPMDIHSSAFGAFDEKIWLKPLNDKDMRQIVINYLNSGRYEKSVDTKPFTEEAVQIIIEESRGIPRVLNLTCFVVLNTAIELGVNKIDKENLPKCLEIASRKKYGDISPHIRYLIDIISKYKVISEEAPDELLTELGVRTFTELFPMLEALVRDDILIKLENAKGMKYFLTPIISGMLKE
jgi:Cdc6-like AAA superfamily ATPase